LTFSDFDLKLRKNILSILLFFNKPVPAETYCKFFTLYTMSKNDSLLFILSKNNLKGLAKILPLCPPPHRPVGFCCSDQLKAGEFLPGCGPQSGAAAVRIPISFWSQAVQSARGWLVLSVARSLVLSKWTAGAAPFWANSQNRSALLHTYQILGEVNLYLVKARSKLSGP
jgi:hypothetical protein